MHAFTRMLLVAALLLAPASSVRAQTAVNPTGHWEGAIQMQPNMDDGGQMRLIVKMANQPDGTATGTIVSPDGSGVEIQIAMTQRGSNVTVAVASVGASFAGVLSAAGTELVGTWTQGSSSMPLTLRLAKP